MAEITREKFKVVGKNISSMESISRPNIGYWQDAWRRLKKNKVAMASMIFIILLTLMAIIAPMVSPYTHDAVNFSAMDNGPSAEHWFGTDNLGRDMWARVWMGARVSLFIAFVAAIVQSTVGIIIGGISGYFGGKVDLFLMRFSDIVDSIPFLVYVMGLGASNMRIIIKHMVPNMLGVIIVTLTMSIPNAIFTEAYLSYIGIGLQPPLTSWGLLANEGAAVIKTYPYQLIIPALFISLTMLCMQLFGDGLRDALDPKLRK